MIPAYRALKRQPEGRSQNSLCLDRLFRGEFTSSLPNSGPVLVLDGGKIGTYDLHAVLMLFYSLSLSCPVADPNPTVIDMVSADHRREEAPGRLNLLSCRRKYNLRWAYSWKESMWEVHFRSIEMVDPRNRVSLLEGLFC